VEHYRTLFNRINYSFKDLNLLDRALTHRSRKNNNEKLEFLGDSILSFVISDYLYKKFPLYDEGKLSIFRSSLIRGDILTEIAKGFMLEEILIIGANEKENIRKNNHGKLLEDALEALIGAIYLDSKRVSVVKNCILCWYKNKLEYLEKFSLLNFKDFKSQLQEFLQKNTYTLPYYDLVQVDEKNNQQVFIVELKLLFIDKVYRSCGRSIKLAQQKVAQMALGDLKGKSISEKNTN